jgi:hypothetical protein
MNTKAQKHKQTKEVGSWLLSVHEPSLSNQNFKKFSKVILRVNLLSYI